MQIILITLIKILLPVIQPTKVPILVLVTALILVKILQVTIPKLMTLRATKLMLAPILLTILKGIREYSEVILFSYRYRVII
jgi:hypothetical protein